jgi:hypothetical protein
VSDLDDPANEGGAGSPEPVDKFYRGTIDKLFRGSQSGVVRSGNGREIPFTFLHVTMVGAVRRFDELREGMPVGFDVGWTAKGLRVTIIRAEPS